MVLFASSVLLALLASPITAVSLQRKAACNADNCLRAVIASSAKPGVTVARSDCASFFATTVTPCPATSTVTTTTTITPSYTAFTPGKRDGDLEGRQATTACPVTRTPSAVPTYASACGGTSRYSSACSCISAPRTTVMASQSTVTTTTRVTVTASAPPNACFIRQNCPASGFDIDYYENNFNTDNYPNGKSSSYYITEGLSVISSSFTNNTAYPYDTSSPTRQVNGGLTVNAANFTLVYQGFYRAAFSGVYQFCTNADNVNTFFIGSDQAFGCADGKPSASAIPLVSSIGASGNNPYNCANISLDPGYYPFRSVAANSEGPSSLELAVYPPYSATSPVDDFSGFAYPLSCGLYS